MAETVRRLTKKGIEAFRAYLNELREGGTALPPSQLLTGPETSESFRQDCSIEERAFDTRLDAARYLCEVFRDVTGLEEDVGLWSWLSLFYFDQVCPVKPDGTRSPGRDYRHILEPGYPYGRRHLLSGAFLVFRLHGEEAAPLLCTKVHQENKFHHELASRQVFLSNSAVIKAASLLYYDSQEGRPKPGAAQGKKAPGTLRRFVDVLQQLDLNYDLYGMDAHAILRLLPDEFDKWKGRLSFYVGELRLRELDNNVRLPNKPLQPPHLSTGS